MGRIMVAGKSLTNNIFGRTVIPLADRSTAQRLATRQIAILRAVRAAVGDESMIFCRRLHSPPE
jgi:hypothetical protein